MISGIKQIVKRLFRQQLLKQRIERYRSNLQPGEDFSVIFGSHWSNHAGWLVLTEDDQDITKTLLFADASVDVIFTEHVIEHVEFTGALSFFKESKRILKTGGVIRIVCPMIDRLLDTSLDDESGNIYIQNCLLTPWVKEHRILNELKFNGIFSFSKTFFLNSIFTKNKHKFIWSADLMIEVLKAVGFRMVSEENIGEGVDDNYCIERRLRGIYMGNDFIVDRSSNHVYDPESIVIEAIK